MDKLNFETLLSLHEHNMNYAKRMMEPDNLEFDYKTKDYWKGYAYACFRMFQDMKMYCDDGYPRMRREITDEEKEKFDIKENFPLCGIIDYRGHQIPVYDDDYGQSMFADIDGEEYGGGTYNLFPEPEFEYLMDSHLDLKDFYN